MQCKAPAKPKHIHHTRTEGKDGETDRDRGGTTAPARFPSAAAAAAAGARFSSSPLRARVRALLSSLLFSSLSSFSLLLSLSPRFGGSSAGLLHQPLSPGPTHEMYFLRFRPSTCERIPETDSTSVSVNVRLTNSVERCVFVRKFCMRKLL